MSNDSFYIQFHYCLQAPCEAEAQCAALVKSGKVYATATEDMDGLTFGSNVLLRHMTFSEARYGCFSSVYVLNLSLNIN